MRNGFTLIEALVVISILTLMTSFLVLYNRTGERQLLLLREKANLINTILRAKNLAFGVLVKEPLRENVCGYGVHFTEREFFLYRDLAVDCEASDRRYSVDNPNELLPEEKFQLHPALIFAKLEISDVLFVPPVPEVFFDGQEAISSQQIVLSSQDEETETKIVINNAGQISQ